jgi:hypothetical protein
MTTKIPRGHDTREAVRSLARVVRGLIAEVRALRVEVQKLGISDADIERAEAKLSAAAEWTDRPSALPHRTKGKLPALPLSPAP